MRKLATACVCVLIFLTSCSALAEITGINDQIAANQTQFIQDAFRSHKIDDLKFYINLEPEKVYHSYTINDFADLAVKADWPEGFEVCVEAGAVSTEGMLETAIAMNNPELVQLVLDNGTEFAYTQALKLALAAGMDDIAISIVDRADVAVDDSMLTIAIANGSSEVALDILSKHNEFDYDTALSLAMKYNKYDVATEIAKRGTASGEALEFAIRHHAWDLATAIAKNGYWSTAALTQAVENNLLELCEALIGAGSPVNTYDIYNARESDDILRILSNAQSFTLNNQYDVRAIEVVINHDLHELALKLATQISEDNADYYSFENTLIAAIEHGMKDVFELILSKGYGITKIDGAITPEADVLVAIIESGDADYLSMYSNYVESYDFVIGTTTPLMYSIQINQQAIFDLLVEYGAEVNYQIFARGRSDIYYYTPLLYALTNSSNSHYALKLIENGADVNYEDSGRSIMYWACAMSSDVQVLQTLVDNGADVNTVYSSENIPLQAAIYNNNSVALNLLFQNGVDFNQTESKYNAAYLAVSSKNTTSETIQTLIDLGMNFDSRIAFEPLLNVACKNVSVETLQTLVEKAQLDVNCTDSYGVTPLMIAAESRDSDIVMYLLDKGAAPNASDKSGKTVFEYARTNRNLAGTEGYRTLNSLRK